VPFVSKATGVPLAKIATKVMLGMTLEQLGFTKEKKLTHWAVKEAVFPFDRFENVDTLLGPEMKSTGEVMGIDDDLGQALAKAQMAAGSQVPLSGTVFVSVRHSDKDAGNSGGQEAAGTGLYHSGHPRYRRSLGEKAG
jgi:carbamoyl-phosphate synthase large subunit